MPMTTVLKLDQFRRLVNPTQLIMTAMYVKE